MERERYLDLLEADGLLLHSAAAADLSAPVPPCPGWTVADAVRHTTEVYEHKVACIGLAGEKPHEWPPAWSPERDPLEWFADARERLLTVLRETDPAAPSWTWWPPDQSAGFWVRRMAQETAVHRVDVQSAFGSADPVDDELAVDGIDEVLTMMLAGDWSDEPQPGSTGEVSVAAGGRSWRCVLTPEYVSLEESRDPAKATVSGDASAVLLWLWGRAPDGAVKLSGDEGVARRFRQRLAIATR
ncbi:MAG TPA: maleylpyruvate isomerase family mycothiol-dependent enzyme [Mycobacteriales bacterium]|nr:maleylpyruvate isomerase family mycothiol-dependent enzyme [Mycobacteriales bacterium]